MAFHQLEKVLARAATNRSFRDELAAGDADLDELGLSDDEQSVLSELVASSGAGLDAVLNVVAALPTNASAPGAAPGVALGSNPPSGLAGLPGLPGFAQPGPLARPGQPNGPALPAPAAGPSPATTTPAFALMTPTMAHAGTVTPALATATPAAAATMSTAMPAGYPLAAPGIPAGYPVPAAGMQSGYPVQPGAVPAGYPAQGPVAAAGYGHIPHPSTQDMTGPPAPAQQPGGGPGVMGTATRALDAGDVGRPVVARLPFGMDVVK
ncbi:MAG TPA: hypothetical protein VFX70_23430 [Mycobacteriales bacterium]|nr:hypothetical protein [Mycobacteriales bacterium]